MKKFSLNKLKGMTLVEVLVALAVFTIISALLASACAGIITIVRKTDRLNKKISNEAPDAEMKKGSVVTDVDGSNKEFSMVIEVNGARYEVVGNQYKTVDSENNYEEGGDFKYFTPDSIK